jgi:hypothetical protein
MNTRLQQFERWLTSSWGLKLRDLLTLRVPTGINCSANPNYPKSKAGDVYVVTNAGKIGGASGDVVEVGDEIQSLADSAAGTKAQVGANFLVVNKNITTSTDGTFASNSDTLFPSEKAVKTYVDGQALAPTSLQKVTVHITEADLTDAVNGEAQSISIGAALPANANVLGHEVNIATLFSGGGAAAVKLDIGGTVATGIVNQLDVFTGAATGALSPGTGAHRQGKFGGQQLAAKFTPDGGHNLAGLTAGDVTITIWYVVLA